MGLGVIRKQALFVEVTRFEPARMHTQLRQQAFVVEQTQVRTGEASVRTFAALALALTPLLFNYELVQLPGPFVLRILRFVLQNPLGV